MLRTLKKINILVDLQNDYDRFAECISILMVLLEWIMMSVYGFLEWAQKRDFGAALFALISHFKAPKSPFARLRKLIDAKWLTGRSLNWAFEDFKMSKTFS